MDEMLERLFGGPRATVSNTLLPVDVYEQDGKFVVKAAVPGVNPDELDIQIENNILTIKGEHKTEETTEGTKVYRREVSCGAFARSIRLPENLNLESVDADFKNGVVTISIPEIEQPKPQAIKVNVRS
ncbi:MAG TPA: Hsp20/alpha crystallin family protein [Fimbriimonadaceae bacterium]|nr:Hsp20/alpha crystallin family protein [Fimbriimonadaceae bacterium]